MQCLEIADWIEMSSSRDNPDLVVLAGDFNSRPGDLPVQVTYNPHILHLHLKTYVILLKICKSPDANPLCIGITLNFVENYRQQV